jgi:preprotein translocase subunit YajC
MGNTIFLAASTSKPSSFNPDTLILILVVVVGFYMLMIRPQQRRRQQAQQQQNTVQPGARVRTTAGMYATVVDVDGDDVVLEVAPGVEVRYMKRAVMDVVSPGDEPAEDVEDSFDDTDETAGYAQDAEDEPDDTTSDDDDWTKVEDDDVAETGSTKKD